jgi:hypothetical protein
MTDTDRTESISRRTVVRGSAWAAPAVLIATAAPAFATSNREFGLNGWVSFGADRDRDCDTTLTLDGRGDYPERGLWVWPTVVGDAVTNVVIDFYIASDTPQLTFTKVGSGTTVWSAPVYQDTTTVDGVSVRRYRMTYLAAITATAGQTLLNNANLQFSAEFTDCDPIRIWARRSAAINGTPYSFIRGPITLLGRSARMAASTDTAAQLV